MHWVVDAATMRGDRATNQDQIVIVDGAAAVLDGATSWLTGTGTTDNRDGGWYASTLGSALMARLPGHGQALTDILKDAITQVRESHALTPGLSPYSTATIARWTSDTLDLLVLGDSPALVGRRDKSIDVIADGRLSATAGPQRASYADHLRRGRGFDREFGELIAAVQRAERHSFNKPDGFWVAEADPLAAEHALHRSYPAGDVSSVVLLSDGAAAGVAEYNLRTWSELVRDLGRGSPGHWLAEVHAAEHADPDGERWARTKRHDDKALVLLRQIQE